jgi:hypothetical protein
MNEPWFGARIAAPFGTFSDPITCNLKASREYGTVTSRVAS